MNDRRALLVVGLFVVVGVSGVLGACSSDVDGGRDSWVADTGERQADADDTTSRPDSSDAAPDVDATPAVEEVRCDNSFPSSMVEVSGTSFTPELVETQAGQVVRWRSTDGAHTVTAGSDCSEGGRFHSGRIPEGSTYCLMFRQPGTYEYQCMIHCPDNPHTGTIEVSPR